MSSYALDFPDDEILDEVGDEVRILPPGGGSSTIRGEFDFKYLENELGEMIDVIVPVFSCGTLDATPIKKGWRMSFDGKTYEVLRKRPVDVRKIMLIMKVI